MLKDHIYSIIEGERVERNVVGGRICGICWKKYQKEY